MTEATVTKASRCVCALPSMRHILQGLLNANPRTASAHADNEPMLEENTALRQQVAELSSTLSADADGASMKEISPVASP